MGGEAYKGYIIAAFAMAALLARPISGKLIDLIGRIPVMVIGASVSFICGTLYLFTSSVVLFLLVRFLHGFSTGFKPTATMTYVADITPQHKRGEALGLMSLFGSLGMASGPALGSFIRIEWGYTPLFISSALLAIASILILFGIRETLPTTTQFSPKMLVIKKHEIFEKSVLYPGLIMVASVFSFGTVLTVVPDFTLSLGIENTGIFFLYLMLASATVRIIAGRASDKYGRVALLKIGLLIQVIGLTLLVFTSNAITLAIAGIIIGFASGINSPTLSAWSADRSPKNALGRGMSTLYIALELGVVLGSYSGGLILNWFDNSALYAFVIAAILSFVGFVLMFFANEESRI